MRLPLVPHQTSITELGLLLGNPNMMHSGDQSLSVLESSRVRVSFLLFLQLLDFGPRR